MRAAYLGIFALALVAGTAGYVLHQALSGTTPPMLPATSANPPAAAGDVPHAWSFADLDGRAVPLASWAGKLLVVNFWATWCPPCLREIPAFVALQQRYAGRGVQFVGVALDQPEAVQSFVSEHDVNYPVLVGADDVVRFMQSLGNAIGGLPYTAVIGARGDVLVTHQGEWPAARAEAAILAHLPEP